jgi:membrane-associated protein
MGIIREAIDFILHLDVHLGQVISSFGALTYAFLFLIIFVETGLVITPFLPGDSLLFVAGAFAALGSLNVFALLVLLMAAAVLGDTVNYWIGRYFGDKVLASPRLRINKKYLAETHAFFDKYGGKTIILARFVPIIRTFAPFVAGIGRMHYARFLLFNAVGGVVWVAVGVVAGYLFGNIPFVKNNFSFFVIGIVIVSLIPVFAQLVRKKRQPEC